MPDPGPRSRPWLGLVLGGLAAACAVAAVRGFLVPDAGAVALAWHGAATLLGAAAPRVLGAGRSEVAMLAAVAAALPGVGGVAVLWFCLTGASRHAANAHAEHDRLLAESVRAGTDLERELKVDSYSLFVRHGSPEQKRNLIRRLAQLGTPRHTGVVRQFLSEDEPEVRLCAHAELSKIGHRHERRIGELRVAAEQLGDGRKAAAALAELAGANRDYATSGALDEEMARYWSEQAELIASRAIAMDPTNEIAQRVLALTLADRGELELAWQIIDSLPADGDEAVELARAEVAFRRRDRAACRAARDRLEGTGAEVPGWLCAVTGEQVVR